VSFVAKLKRRHRTSGSLAALVQLGDCVRQSPDATLDELRGWLAALGGPAVSRSALGRAVQKLDWRRKKRVSTPPNATRNE